MSRLGRNGSTTRLRCNYRNIIGGHDMYQSNRTRVIVQQSGESRPQANEYSNNVEQTIKDTSASAAEVPAPPRLSSPWPRMSFAGNKSSNKNKNFSFFSRSRDNRMRWHEYIDDRENPENGKNDDEEEEDDDDEEEEDIEYRLYRRERKIMIRNPLDSQDWRRLLAPRTLTPAERYTVVDWWKNIISIPKSQVLRRIFAHLLVNVGVAVGLIILNKFGVMLPEISAFPHTTVATALGLLLIFRTNASYDRFWEARKTWTKITNTCRGIARMGTIYIRNSELAEIIVRYSMAFPISLKHRLRGRRIRSDYYGVLTNSEINKLDSIANVPYHLSCKMSELLSNAVLGGYLKHSDQQLIEPLIQELLEGQGSCERILRTPVPLSYSRHTSRFLSLWNITLPFILVRKGMGMFAVVATFAVALYVWWFC